MNEIVDTEPLFAPALRVLAGGDESRYMLVNDGRRADARVLARYVAVPSLSNPRALLAMDAPQSAWRTALEQHANGAASRSARAIARLLQISSYLGLNATLFRDRLALVTTGNQATAPLHEFLSEILGRNDFVTNLRIAPGRPNSKPVVQVVSTDGKALAFAKFGWDGLTKRLIRHEAATLGQLGTQVCLSGLHVPQVIWSGDWNGLETLVLAPLEGMGKTPWHAADVPVAASIALSGARPRTRSRLEESNFWRRVAIEVERVTPRMEPKTGQILFAARAAIQERWGDVELHCGQGHGDWIPPNISIRYDGACNVWDWERSEPDVPLGLDTLQFILFVEFNKRALSVDLMRRVEMQGRRALLRQDLSPDLVQLFASLSLLRSLLWFGEARLAGRTGPEDYRFARALELFLFEGHIPAVYGSTGASFGCTIHSVQDHKRNF